jgi:adenylate kinase
MKNIIFFGPPGSGKDTQISELRKSFNFEFISGGDIARSLGEKNKKIKETVSEGGLIKDDLILEGADAMLKNIPAELGVVFDGFPRTIYQAEKLSEIMYRNGRTIDSAVYIALDEDKVVERLSKRKVCSMCSQNLPVGSEVCPKCGGRAITRPDDEPATVIKRVQTFLEKTLPLVSYYRDRGILVEVNGDQKVVDVARDIKAKLGLTDGV